MSKEITRNRRISATVRTAIEAMVWQGLKRPDAAQMAGMKDNSLYIAMRKPDVKAYYLAECEVFRLSGRAKRLHRLQALADQDENKNAAVAAIKAAEQISDPVAALGPHAQRLPGITIVIQGGSAIERAIPRPVTDITPKFEIDGEETMG